MSAVGIGQSVIVYPLTELAGRCEAMIVAEYKRLSEVTIELGRLLFEFEQGGHWSHLFMPDGITRWQSFDKWLRGQPDLGYSTCRRAMQVYKLGQFFDVEETELAEIDPSKLVELNPLLAQQRSAAEFAMALVNRVEELGLIDRTTSLEAQEGAFRAAQIEAQALIAMGQSESRTAIKGIKEEQEGWHTRSYTVKDEQELEAMLSRMRHDFRLGKPIYITAKQYR